MPEIPVTTELTIAVREWRLASVAELAAAVVRLKAAGEAYLAAEAAGAVPPRRYTSQLAWAAKNCSAARPHERGLALETITEIETPAQAELREERNAGGGRERKGPLPESWDRKAGLTG